MDIRKIDNTLYCESLISDCCIRRKDTQYQFEFENEKLYFDMGIKRYYCTSNMLTFNVSVEHVETIDIKLSVNPEKTFHFNGSVIEYTGLPNQFGGQVHFITISQALINDAPKYFDGLATE